MTIALGEYMLRPYEDGDIETIPRYANNRKIWKNLTDSFPHPYTEQNAREWVAYTKTHPQEINFAIAAPDGVIGGIGVVPGTGVFCKSGSIGYWLGEPFWGKGLMTQAARAVTAHVFAQTDLARLSACVYETNPASMRVLEKVGYTFESRLRKAIFKDGALLDEMVYAMLRNEWEQRQ